MTTKGEIAGMIAETIDEMIVATIMTDVTDETIMEEDTVHLGTIRTGTTDANGRPLVSTRNFSR